MKDEEAANKFLREGLTPLLSRHQCAAVIMHHTPKTQFNPSADFTTTDFMYRGSGCASMTNWARAYLVFEPEKKLHREYGRGCRSFRSNHSIKSISGYLRYIQLIEFNEEMAHVNSISD